jgi:hypothetical protein
MNKDAPSFREWYQSPANPLQRSSDMVLHFSVDAMKAAFEAGMEYQKRLAYERSHPDPFSFKRPASVDS